MPIQAARLVCLGNAIVDVLGEADDGLLSRLGLPKGVMRAVGAAEAESVQAALEARGTPRAVPGGSAANSAAVAACLGAPSSFLGRVRDDGPGRAFAAAMEAAGVAFPVRPAADGAPTSRCVVVVTPDGERTMSTHLGACQALSAADVAGAGPGEGGILFVEGYAWMSPGLAATAGVAVREAAAAGATVALTLSDPGVAAAHRGEFLSLAGSGAVRLAFANAREILALSGEGDVDAALDRLVPTGCSWVVTLGADGCVVAAGGDRMRIPAAPVARVVDTTGAGDAFAGGYLAGALAGAAPDRCARLGALAAGHVIARVGARPGTGLAAEARAAGLAP